MIITNIHGLPDVLYQKIMDDVMDNPYDDPPADTTVFRVSELISPPRIKTLYEKYRHGDDMIVDASEYMFIQFGTAFHKLMEECSDDSILREFKMSLDYKIDGKKYRLNGTADEIDLYEEGVHLNDDKVTNLMSVNYDVKDTYQMQTNLYAMMYRSYLGKFDLPISITIRMFLRDWAASSAARNNSIPQAPFYRAPVECLSFEDQYKLLVERTKDHIENPMRMCTVGERNFNSDKPYGVCKKGNKQRSASFATEEEAWLWIDRQKDKNRCYIETDSMCRIYCKSRSVCPYFKEKYPELYEKLENTRCPF